MPSALDWSLQDPLEDEKILLSLYTGSRETLEAKLDECEAAQAEIDDMLELCINRKVQYRAYAGMLKIALNKRKKRPELPSEIWATIFSACDLASFKGQYDADPTPIQCTLSLVCRAWRRIVVSSPRLWIYLPVWEPGTGIFYDEEDEARLKPRERYVKLLQLHCERSGALLLHATVMAPLTGFTEKQSTKIYKIWERAFPRFKTLKIYVEHDVWDLRRFSQLSQNFPSLRSINVRFCTARYPDPDDMDPFIPPPVSILQHAPLLHQADLNVV